MTWGCGPAVANTDGNPVSQLDELELQVVPVLLGQGRRLFDNLPAEHIELNLVRRLSTPEVTHLRYRVRRP